MLKKRAPVPRAHAPTAANAHPPRSALRATIVHRVQRPVDAPPMATGQPVPHAPTVSVPPPASAHRAPVVLIQTDLAQTALGQTALPLTGQLSIAHFRTAEVVTNVPLESDPVVRRARSMTVPALASVLRARLFRTSFTTRLLPFK